MSSTQTYETSPQHADAAGYDALIGHPLGRRERIHGRLRVFADVAIARVIEANDDLAIADRVAYVLAHRTQQTYAVVAAPRTYLVVLLDQELHNHDAYALQLRTTTPGEPAALRMLSLVTHEGVTPIMLPPTN